MHGGLGDLEASGHFLGGEHTTIAQALATTGQVISSADESDFLEIERLAVSGPQAAFIEDVGDLAIAITVEQAVDLGDQVGLGLRIWKIGSGRSSVLRRRAARLR